MEKKEYDTGSIYQGGASSLDPNYGALFTGYHVPSGELGAPTKPDTANQLQQVSQLLSQGIVPIEIGTIDPNVFDQIPKQHFKEIGRMAKLTGAKISVHAPVQLEVSGMTEQGWSEASRELAERQLKDVIDKSIEADTSGNMPVTIHSSGLPGTEYSIQDGKKKIEKIIIVDRETGKPVQALEEERLYSPDAKELKSEVLEKLNRGEIGKEEVRKEDFIRVPLEKGELLSPERRLDSLNSTQWDNSISQLIFNKERADEILSQNQVQIQHFLEDYNAKRITEEVMTPSQIQALNHLRNAQTYLEDTRQSVKGLFNKAYKNGTQEERKLLKDFSETFQKDLSKDPSPTGQSAALQGLLFNLKEISPQLFIPVEKFAIDKSSQTFANVAFHSFNKYKDKSPMISIENMFPGMAFSAGSEMKELILDKVLKNKKQKKLLE